MLNWLKYFQLEKISFFIGFFTATILWFVFLYIKKWIPSINEFIKNTKKLKNIKKSDLIKLLKKAGWNEEIINKVLN